MRAAAGERHGVRRRRRSALKIPILALSLLSLTACSALHDEQIIGDPATLVGKTKVCIEVQSESPYRDRVRAQIEQHFELHSRLKLVPDRESAEILVLYLQSDQYVCLDSCPKLTPRGPTFWLASVYEISPGSEPSLVALLEGRRDIFSNRAVVLFSKQLGVFIAEQR